MSEAFKEFIKNIIGTTENYDKMLNEIPENRQLALLQQYYDKIAEILSYNRDWEIYLNKIEGKTEKYDLMMSDNLTNSVYHLKERLRKAQELVKNYPVDEPWNDFDEDYEKWIIMLKEVLGVDNDG